MSEASAAAPREWFVIESSRKNGVFSSADDQKPMGYIPRDVAECIIGRDLAGTVWFTAAEGAVMRAHPEWKNELPGALICDVEGMTDG
jgi:hypothetical protein